MDFQRKAVDRVVEQRRRGEGKDRDTGHASDEDTADSEPIPEPANPEEQW